VDRPSTPADNEDMAEPTRQAHRQEWFVDPRSPDRRMKITWHPDDSLAVVSLWQGPTCTATFRLPARDTARLIGVLADGLADGWHVAPPSTTAAPSGLLGRVRGWLARHRAPQAPLTLINGGS